MIKRLVTSGWHWLRPPSGLYEVLEHDASLELKDVNGERAVYRKRQVVRFLQDNTIAWQDKAWGDGDIFAKYKVAPGKAVDRYREGHRWRILISLRETKQRGDKEEFNIERHIKNGFTKSSEYLQTEIDHRTRRLKLSIVFPRKRPPRIVRLVEQNTPRTQTLSSDHFQTLPDGRTAVTWRKRYPRRYEAYIMAWEW